MTRSIAAVLALSALAGCAAAAQPGTAPPGAARGDVLVVGNKQEATASILEVESGRTLAVLPTGTGPHEAAVSHDGRWAVVTDYGDQTPGSSLTVIDLDALQVARKIDLLPHRRPHGIAFLPGDTALVVTSETSQAVLRVDFRTGAIDVLPTGQAGSHMLAVAPDGRTVFTANVGSGSVTRIDLATGDTAIAAVAPATEGIGVTADGRQVWVGSNARHTVTVLDARTLAPVDTLAAPGLPYRVYGGTGRMLVSAPMGGVVHVFDAASRAAPAAIAIPVDPARLVPGGPGGAGPVGGVVTPDGRRAYVALQGMNAVAVIDLETNAVVKLLDTGAGPDGIALSVRYR